MDYERRIGPELRMVSNLIKRMHEGRMPDAGVERITAVQGWVLSYLYDNTDTDIFQRDVEREFRIRRSTATTILQGMERNGMIIRTPVAHDGRLKKLELTQEARRRHAEVMRNMDEMEDRLCTGISEEELASFFLTLDKIRANLDTMLDSPEMYDGIHRHGHMIIEDFEARKRSRGFN